MASTRDVDLLNYVKRFRRDGRLADGRYFPERSIGVRRGETVGVVLINFGGPETTSEIRNFLYSVLMDPAVPWFPTGGILRKVAARVVASTQSRRVGDCYDAIGGSSPINRLTKEMSTALQRLLNQQTGDRTGVRFLTFVGMRYGRPSFREALAAVERSGADKLVLLPLFPHYSQATTGSSLALWEWLLREQKATMAVGAVREYAAHPKYIQSISERIDQALQRFPREARSNVELLFCGHSIGTNWATKHRDSFCCLAQATVDRVMQYRGNDYGYGLSYLCDFGLGKRLAPAYGRYLQEISSRKQAVLVVPISVATDHLGTTYELDVRVRAQAASVGVKYFEVTTGLNCHSLFVEALADVVCDKLEFLGFSTTPDQRERAMRVAASSGGLEDLKSVALFAATSVARSQPGKGPLLCARCKRRPDPRLW